MVLDKFDLNKDGKVDMKDLTHAAKGTAEKVRSESKKNVLTAILAAFGFIIALVWRDAIRAGVDMIVKRLNLGEGYLYQVVVALIVTIIAVIAIIIISRLKGKEDVK
jgi:hypothetical protein|tara:strand:+ start:163 stop:483 length:321 start_codon:yes stop_codon:yes gene_type:complete